MKIIKESTLFDTAKEFCLKNASDWSTLCKNGSLIVTIPDKGTIVVKPYKNKIGVYDYESGTLDLTFDSISEFKTYLRKANVI